MTNNALEKSRVVGFVRRCRSVLRALLEPPKRAGSRLARYVRGSYIYRWLTTEPEPEVIVIDLRETYTVGPFIRGFDRVLEGLVASYGGSRTESLVVNTSEAGRARPIRMLGIVGIAFVTVWLLAAGLTGALSTGSIAGQFVLLGVSLLALRSTRSLEQVLETRTAKVLVSAFEPPEPPSRASETERSRSSPSDEPLQSSPSDQVTQSLEESDDA
ncbi:hypothetical protein [Halostagnicola sp. A-GB9-2]|uniref:hypothetical protein n=1 Tax=Halostagnicola sp. A-GB9-2 TaxID=3048066 RepID=UPI0024C055D3|nr:hypothetical protein [Halostagnicola sp. A-GB9-2]MDJ1430842.1 hypothetical protein [Halostagnicola sp. A-GB9-2]